ARLSRRDAERGQLIEKVDAFKRARGLRDDGVIPQPAPAPAPAPSEPERRDDAADAAAAGPDVEALLALDGPAIEEALARARAIAARLIKEGANGDDALERLLVVDVPSLAPPPLARPPAATPPAAAGRQAPARARAGAGAGTGGGARRCPRRRDQRADAGQRAAGDAVARRARPVGSRGGAHARARPHADAGR